MFANASPIRINPAFAFAFAFAFGVEPLLLVSLLAGFGVLFMIAKLLVGVERFRQLEPRERVVG